MKSECRQNNPFQRLTGSNQFVGNWPGVTVEKKEGRLKGHKDVIITDLPGIYSLSPYTLEEVVARNYLIGERPDAILNIIDGTNLERNLYLTTQLVELGIPVVCAVNMIDAVRKNGDKINIEQLSKELGWSFIKKAGTIILLSTVVLWFLQSFGIENGSFGMTDELNNSVLAKLGGIIAPIFAPLGWGDWKAAVAAVTGLIAKENVVATFGTLFHFGGEISENGDEIWGLMTSNFTALSGYSFLVFNLLCAPCFAAMGAIRREMNNAKWTAFAIGYQCLFAYAVSLIIYQFVLLFTGSVNVIGLIFAVIILAFMVYMLVRPYKESSRLTRTVKLSS